MAQNYGRGGSDVCPICHTQIANLSITDCNHRFCHDCIRRWTSSHASCPVCRQNISTIRNILPDGGTEIIQISRAELLAHRVNDIHSILILLFTVMSHTLLPEVASYLEQLNEIARDLNVPTTLTRMQETATAASAAAATAAAGGPGASHSPSTDSSSSAPTNRARPTRSSTSSEGASPRGGAISLGPGAAAFFLRPVRSFSQEAQEDSDDEASRESFSSSSSGNARHSGMSWMDRQRSARSVSAPTQRQAPGGVPARALALALSVVSPQVGPLGSTPARALGSAAAPASTLPSVPTRIPAPAPTRTPAPTRNPALALTRTSVPVPGPAVTSTSAPNRNPVPVAAPAPAQTRTSVPAPTRNQAPASAPASALARTPPPVPVAGPASAPALTVSRTSASASTPAAALSPARPRTQPIPDTRQPLPTADEARRTRENRERDIRYLTESYNKINQVYEVLMIMHMVIHRNQVELEPVETTN